MTIQALIFDVDGTLAETEEAHREAFNLTFARWRLDWNWSVDDYRELLKVTGGKERIAAFQDGQSDLPKRLAPEAIARLHKEKTAAYSDILARGGLALRPGVAELIETARGSGLKIAVATTTNTPNVEALCQCCWGIAATRVFDTIAAGDMVKRKKPAPDVFLLALDQLGLDADQCIALEDSRNGVLSAKAAGLRVLVTPSGYTRDDDFSKADWVVNTLTRDDLPKQVAGQLTPVFPTGKPGIPENN